MARRILILDWDDVVTSTADILKAINAVFLGAGAPQDLVESTYVETKGDGNGYRPTVQARLIAKYLNLDPDPMIEQLTKVMANTERFVFKDARQFIEAMHKRGEPLGVLTAGDPWFQVHKIAMSGLHDKFSMVEVVSGQNYIEEKVGRIRRFLERFESVVMFDDRVPILRRMQQVWSDAVTPIFVNRKKEPLLDQGMKAITSFSDKTLNSLIS